MKTKVLDSSFPRRASGLAALLALAFSLQLSAFLLSLVALSAPAATLPEATTLPAANFTLSSVELQGTVNPHGAPTAVWFEYGVTTNYGSVTSVTNLGSGTLAMPVVTGIAGLVLEVTYHGRIVASNSLGTTLGADVAFTPWFTELDIGLPEFHEGDVAWGDYDNDGDLDVLLAGYLEAFPVDRITAICRNDGGGVFTDIKAMLPGVSPATVAWSDYDNDGDLDLLFAGLTTISGLTTRLYRNDGSDTFHEVNAGLPRAFAVAWGDADNDGDQDILLAGFGTPECGVRLFRNEGNGQFADANAGLCDVDGTSAAWGDYDNDGRLDLVLTSTSGTESLSGFYHNEGTGKFSWNTNTQLPGVNYGALAWGDYDNDGDVDLVLAGWSGANRTRLYRNDGDGRFAEVDAGLVGVSNGDVAWGDYDNDGDLDLLLTGLHEIEYVTRIYRNDGVDTFTDMGSGLPGVYTSAVAWGDFDNDGDLDILLTGHYYNTEGHLFMVTKVFENRGHLVNTAPTVPTGLRVSAAGSEVLFHWNSATDHRMPPAGLTYNVRIGSSPGAREILAPQSAGDGFRRLPAMGNAQQRLSCRLVLPASRAYYWSVQAVDTGYRGSAFATEQSFSFLTVIGAASGLVPGDTDGDGAVTQSELDIVLSNYWSHSPWMQMTNFAAWGRGTFQFAFTNASGWHLGVLVSTNLADWEPLGSAWPAWQFEDPVATNFPQRFYQLRWP